MAVNNMFASVLPLKVVYFFAPVKIKFINASGSVNVSIYSHVSSSVFACPDDVPCVKGCVISQMKNGDT
eukprot:10209648-Ditylum_brightwellii.AAC.1